MTDKPLIYTVGHSTHPLDEFLTLLQTYGVQILVDVRSVPRSRWVPQFNRETLLTALAQAGIRYEHMKGLGGWRHARANSPNTGWRTEGFRGYADYMQTAEFASNIDQLIALAQEAQAAIMCAEAVYWRCHRSLIADALLVRGIRVEHILSPTKVEPHQLTPFAHVEGIQITYPAPPSS